MGQLASLNWQSIQKRRAASGPVVQLLLPLLVVTQGMHAT